MRNFQRGSYFRGCLNIRPTLSFEETVRVLSNALGITFTEDQDGKYEEFPAYQAFAIGLEFALLAPPSPEDDIREHPDDNFQLLVRTRTYTSEVGADIDLSAFIENILKASTQLVIERLEYLSQSAPPTHSHDS